MITMVFCFTFVLLFQTMNDFCFDLVSILFVPRFFFFFSRKTSDLIPLCHPLPIDQISIHIHLCTNTNTATIDCKCTVTHKTGVEMEAMVGASVAALTIYDMVKAVSHEVKIEQVSLIEKTGGKRLVKDGVLV